MKPQESLDRSLMWTDGCPIYVFRQGGTMKRVNAKALKLAHEIVSDPGTRAKIKAALKAEGKPGLAALIDDSVVVSRELIRLAEAA